LPQLDVLPRRKIAKTFTRRDRRQHHAQHLATWLVDALHRQCDDAVRVRHRHAGGQYVVAVLQVVFHCVAYQGLAFQSKHRLDSRKHQCMGRAGVGASGAAHHAVEGVYHHGFLALEVKAVN
jgi:hypothetical protein